MLVTTRGIVLHILKYSESSIICKVFTEENGLLSFIVNGVRSSKGKDKVGLFQPLQIVELTYQIHENKNLLHLKEFRAAVNFQQLPYKFQRAGIGLFLLEIFNKTIRIEKEAHREKFQMMTEGLLYLDQAEKVAPCFHLSFMLKYISFLGYEMEIEPETDYFDLQSGRSCHTPPKHANYLQGEDKKCWDALQQRTYHELEQLTVSSQQRAGLLKHIEYFYRYHIEHFAALKSPEVLAEIYHA